MRRVWSSEFGHAIRIFAAIGFLPLAASAQFTGPLHDPLNGQEQTQQLQDPGMLPGTSQTPDRVTPDLATSDLAQWFANWPVREPALPEFPEVAIDAGRRIAVVLDTPISTRIGKKNQLVTFRSSGQVRLSPELAIPPGQEFVGRVTEIKRPGRFGKPGLLRVSVESLRLDTGGEAPLQARLDSADMVGRGRAAGDNRSANAGGIVMGSLQGTLVGAVVGGSRGAMVGAGAGAAIAVIVMMSHRGQDIYLEPGMPFTVVLEQPAYLNGEQVYMAQKSYRERRAASGPTPQPDPASDPEMGAPPQLKRRGSVPREPAEQ
jgi:hypothetical protein